jgi:hypothetical protein
MASASKFEIRHGTYGFELADLLAGSVELLPDLVQVELLCSSNENPW